MILQKFPPETTRLFVQTGPNCDTFKILLWSCGFTYYLRQLSFILTKPASQIQSSYNMSEYKLNSLRKHRFVKRNKVKMQFVRC